MQWITSLGEIKGFTCVRGNADEKSHPWFKLDCESSCWYFEWDDFSIRSGSVSLHREVGDQGWDYAFHDIRLFASLMTLALSTGDGTSWHCRTVREGETFPIIEDEDLALGVVRGCARMLSLDVVEHMYFEVDWVDANLQTVDRREIAKNEAKLRVLQTVCAQGFAQYPSNAEKEYERLVLAHEVIISRRLRNGTCLPIVYGTGSCWIEDRDFEYLLDLYAVMNEAARSINAHIDRKDYKPNQAKLEAYVQKLDLDYLHGLAKRSDYAKELEDRALMIKKSAEKGYQTSVEWIRAYRPSLFPRTSVRVWDGHVEARNLKDLKFRYIIPLDEENERGELGFLFDEQRLKDRAKDSYEDAMVGEAQLFLLADSGNLDAVLREVPNVAMYDYPEGTDEKEKIVAVYVAKERLATDDGMQKAIDTYFKGKPIDENSESLKKHFGYPW